MSAAGRRSLPSTAALAEHPAVDAAVPHPLRVRAARAVLERARRAPEEDAPDVDGLAARVQAWLDERLRGGPRPVINATGVVVHTNLGRAPLSDAARAAVLAAAGACDLELDLASGRRGSRQDHVAPLLATVCDAEDGLCVTNNAAAVLLVLRVLCRGREVLVSRGEAVEIGGGFRVPEVLRESGARLVDVGTTNRTRAADYAAAVTPRTAAILRVHPGNFAVRGFTERPDPRDLAAVARAHDLLLLEDCGSGALTGPGRGTPALAGEVSPAAALAAGADLVTFSGDKLVGGPQAGLIAGRAALCARLRRAPLLRALRPDKLVIAALVATLRSHLLGTAESDLPVLAALAADPVAIRVRADRWAQALRADGIPAAVETADSVAGGGALPDVPLATACLVLPGPPARVAAALRAGRPPVVARVAGGRLWLDPRTVAIDEEEALLAAVRAASAAVRPR